MKIILTLIIASISLFACSSGKKAAYSSPASTEQTPETASELEQDGSSYEKAIIINEKKSRSGIDAEHVWIKSNYPGSKMVKQALQHQGKKSYDILTIETEAGEKKDIYFDITSFLENGKFLIQYISLSTSA